MLLTRRKRDYTTREYESRKTVQRFNSRKRNARKWSKISIAKCTKIQKTNKLKSVELTVK